MATYDFTYSARASGQAIVFVAVPAANPFADILLDDFGHTFSIIDQYAGSFYNLTLFLQETPTDAGTNNYKLTPYQPDGMGGSEPCPEVDYMSLGSVDGSCHLS